MSNYLNLPIAVCYPGGAGGNFVASVLDHALFNKKFKVSSNGNCDDNDLSKLPHYIPSGAIHSQRQELDLIEYYIQNEKINTIGYGHIRNLIALQETNYNFWFIKIVYDATRNLECEILCELLTSKKNLDCALKNCYDQVRDSSWPQNFEDFKQHPESIKKYHQAIINGYKNWYWVENHHTKIRTIELSLSDIFLGKISTKLSQWFDLSVCNKLDYAQNIYQDINQKLYPKLLEI